MRCDDDSAAIRLRGVSWTANGTEILKDLDLDIAAGQFVLVLGPNGAGKTTMLKLIDGLIQPASGVIRLFGSELRPSNVKALTRRVAYLAQDVAPDARIPISVSEVVSIGRLAHKPAPGRLNRKDREIVEGAIEAVGIRNLKTRPFGYLSAGQKQKVSLARALAQEADVMLLDEPLSNLDPQAQEDICDTIDHIHASTHKTILLVTHMLERLPQHARRALVMREGTITGRVSVDSISDARVRQHLYDGPAGSRRTMDRTG